MLVHAETTPADNAANGRASPADAEAVAARALRADEDAPVDPQPSHEVRAKAEILRLVNAIVEPRSVSLQRAISQATDKKMTEAALATAHRLGETDEEYQAWLNARTELEAEAGAVIEAPIAAARDALVRADAFIDLVGRNEKGLPEDDNTDTEALIAGYRDALETLAARERDTDEWDDAVSAYRRADREVIGLYQEGEFYDRAKFVEPGLRDDLKARMGDARARRDETRTAVLTMTPPDIGGLLVKMEIVAERLGYGNLRTYASREHARGPDAFTSDVLFSETLSEDEVARRAMALLATDAAELRDRALPDDWQAVVDAHRLIPGIRDSVRNAYAAGLHPDDITCIRTDRGLGEAAPILVIERGDGKIFHAQANEVWVGEPVK